MLLGMASTSHSDSRSIEWGEDECQLCNDSTWISLVLYEPIDAIDEHEDGIQTHPSPKDDHPIAICGPCLFEAQRQLSVEQGIERDDVGFNDLANYLTYQVHPEYIKKLHPEAAQRYSKISE